MFIAVFLITRERVASTAVCRLNKSTCDVSAHKVAIIGYDDGTCNGFQVVRGCEASVWVGGILDTIWPLTRQIEGLSVNTFVGAALHNLSANF